MQIRLLIIFLPRNNILQRNDIEAFPFTIMNILTNNLILNN